MNQHTLPKAVWKTIVAVFLLMPLVVTVVYAFSTRWVHILPEGFTLHYIAATLDSLPTKSRVSSRRRLPALPVMRATSVRS